MRRRIWKTRPPRCSAPMGRASWWAGTGWRSMPIWRAAWILRRSTGIRAAAWVTAFRIRQAGVGGSLVRQAGAAVSGVRQARATVHRIRAEIAAVQARALPARRAAGRPVTLPRRKLRRFSCVPMGNPAGIMRLTVITGGTRAGLGTG